LVGSYLIALGVLSLLSLRPIGFTFNLGGVLLIWFGVKVRERHEGFRKASLWFLGLCLAAGLLVLGWATVAGTEGISVTFLQEHAAPSLGLVYAAAIPTLVVFGLPFWWLWQDSYRHSPAPDLRATKDTG
jgi:hypothetical protein